MISRKKQVAEEQRVAALRGRMVFLTVLELFSSDLEELSQTLAEKAAQAPEFFGNAPLLLDFAGLETEVDIYWLEKVKRLLLDNNFIPVGITGASELLEVAARATAIAVWPAGGAARQVPEMDQPESDNQQNVVDQQQAEQQRIEEQQAEQQRVEEQQAEQQREDQQAGQPPEPSSDQETTLPQTHEHTETLVVRQPVRSGQKIYARGGDLIVLASVNTGAEILADGHIHVYGTLRGRAIAGAQGMESARIFCKDLQADLIAIAGYYIISDDLPEDKRNKAMQIFLREEQFKFEPL